jgi:hypothetical protein
MNAAIEAIKQLKLFNSSNLKIYIVACQQQISGTFEAADCLFKELLLAQASHGIEIIMEALNSYVKGARKDIIMFPEDGQLFWSRIDQICRNDAQFVSHFPSGFKKHFFRYKNSLEACNHLKKSIN